MTDFKRTRSKAVGFLVSMALLVLLSGYACAAGQQPKLEQNLTAARPMPLAIGERELPDSPGAVLAGMAADPEPTDPEPTAVQLPDRTKTAADSAGYIKWAPKYHRTVHPDERAYSLTPMDKLKLSLMSRLTLGEAASTVVGAGWSQLRNSRPNYGTDSGAFGERMGALAIKQTSQAFFSYGVFPALLHQDPRYYILGDTKPFKRRIVYAAVTVVMTQNDQGNSVINSSRLAGIAAATALTTAYYPVQNHGFGNESKAFGASIATAVLNSELHEFGGDIFGLFRHKHQ